MFRSEVKGSSTYSKFFSLMLSFVGSQAIVKCGGYDVLHKQLEHASQRLIISTLECIRNMSDVSTKDMDVSPLLNKLLQLLGTF